VVARLGDVVDDENLDPVSHLEKSPLVYVFVSLGEAERTAASPVQPAREAFYH
jgi:hypothetical protein